MSVEEVGASAAATFQQPIERTSKRAILQWGARWVGSGLKMHSPVVPRECAKESCERARGRMSVRFFVCDSCWRARAEGTLFVSWCARVVMSIFRPFPSSREAAMEIDGTCIKKEIV